MKKSIIKFAALSSAAFVLAGVNVMAEEAVSADSSFATQAEAEAAAKSLLANDPINQSFTVTEREGKFFITLSPEETQEVVKETPATEKPATETPAQTPITDKAFDSKEAAEAAAKEHLKSDKVNHSFAVIERDGKFFVQLSTEDKVEVTKAPETTVDPLETGFKTVEEAIKAAEALLEEMPWNNGYDIQQGADDLFYIRLTTDGTKTVNRKPVETTEAKKEDNGEKLPETGEVSSYTFFGGAVLSVLAGLGLVTSKANKDNE